ncbi:MAG: Activating signal cointegrator 1, partial [Paramarteilia canceri]
RLNCGCEASLHSLINNCLNCGRIVCLQEGEGPCFTCSQPVDSKLRSFIQKNDNNNNKLTKAIEFKDSLISRGATKSKIRSLIDDDLDYFSLDQNVWMNQEEKEKMTQAEAEIKKDQKFNETNPEVDIVTGELSFKEFNAYQEAKDRVEMIKNEDIEIKNKSKGLYMLWSENYSKMIDGMVKELVII